MIPEDISFTGRLSLQDFLDFTRVHSLLVLRRSIRYILTAFSLLISALVVFLGVRTHFTFGMIFILALCAYFAFGMWIIEPFQARRRYYRFQDKFTDNTAILTSESIFTISEAADVRMNWDQLVKIIDTKHGLFFVLRPRNVWFMLPQRVFEGNRHKETIISHAGECGIPVRWMRI